MFFSQIQRSEPTFSNFKYWIKTLSGENPDLYVQNIKQFLSSNKLRENDPGTLEKARAYIYKEVIKLCNQESSLGYYFRGYLENNGYGCKKDPKNAVKWARKSVEAGNSWGMASLGFYYEKGDGIERDLKIGAEYYLQSAQAGNPLGMNNISFCYSHGLGITRDHKKSFYWAIQSAEKGNHLGMNSAGVAYTSGNGCERNQERAIYWFLKAIQTGETNFAPRNVESLIENYPNIYLEAKNKIQKENDEIKLRPHLLYILFVGREKEPDCVLYKDRFPLDLFKFLIELVRLLYSVY